MKRISLFFSITLLVGCSQVERIGANSEVIRSNASDTISHLEVIMEADDFSVIEGEAALAISKQEEIVELASDIQMTLPKVRDATPWWANLIDRAFIAASILGVTFLVWHLGVGHLVKRIFWAMGMFIPKGAMRSAELDFKVNTNRVTPSEAIAARRGGDHAYEAARKKLRKRGY
tara:strand:+ start:12802 stop:13326 length:525 start_codon:yes stop_codon:yes gene_type:complete